ncbi:hypothetical protein GSI_15361 [Ganoderma sinense ZZ0214-1]|uniref:Uncharacterized protein n=1 Tax=Ganoderma sinense ZZ0214-1 TaxID=1077348 RepID=A0A2G8RMX6_9APHY|nr:hypothetical protein GSI_15361 [Ganoderma sinense ZZ0214-1]
MVCIGTIKVSHGDYGEPRTNATESSTRGRQDSEAPAPRRQRVAAKTRRRRAIKIGRGADGQRLRQAERDLTSLGQSLAANLATGDVMAATFQPHGRSPPSSSLSSPAVGSGARGGIGATYATRPFHAPVTKCEVGSLVGSGRDPPRTVRSPNQNQEQAGGVVPVQNPVGRCGVLVA